MNVSINLPADVETALFRRAAAAGKDVETLVKEFVTERLVEETPPPAKPASHDDFMAKLHQIIDLHPTSNDPVDDSRESIYAGRGE
jgi:plasmid stability protein